MIKSIGRPIIHSADDPTGLGRLRARCLKEFKKRVRAIEPELKAIIKTTMQQSLVDTVQVNEVVILPKAHIVNKTQYVYEISPQRMSEIDTFIKRLIYRNMLGLEDNLWSAQWWFNTYSRQAVETGYKESLQSAQNLSPASIVGQEISTEIRSIEYEQILQQPYYRRRLDAVYGRTFNSMVGFSDDSARIASGIFARAITSGLGYRSVAKELTKAMDDMAGWRALRIVRTELNKSATDAHMANTKDLNRDVYAKGDFEVAVMHLSALAENSRIWHMSRSGQIFTPQEQEDWWNDGSNRLNCQCSIADILRDKKTGEVLQTALHRKAIEQRERRIGA
jgi:hypothetical protein